MGSPHNPQQYQDDPSSAIPGNIYPSMLPNQQAVPPGTGNAPVNSNVPMNANHQTSSCGQPSQPHWTTTGQVANPGAQNPNVIANAYAPMNATQQPIPQAACNLQANPGQDQGLDNAGMHQNNEATAKPQPSDYKMAICLSVGMILMVILSVVISVTSGCPFTPCSNDEVCNYDAGPFGFCEPCPSVNCFCSHYKGVMQAVTPGNYALLEAQK